MIPDDRYLAAAMRALGAEEPGTTRPDSPEELEFDLEAAIARNDLVRVYELIPRLAALDDVRLAVYRAKLQLHFKRDFRVPDFNRAIDTSRKRTRAAKAASTAAVVASDLPAILTTDRHLRDISTDALAALRQANNPPFLFVRSGSMVHVVIDEHQRPKIESASLAYLRGRIDRVANFQRKNKDGDHKPVTPPKELVDDILGLPPDHWGLPPLTAVVEVPTLRPNGTILDTPGYDAASRMYYAPSVDLDVPPVPEDPMSDDVSAAIDFIDEAIGEFPYVDASSRANVFGLLLTPIIRPALAGGCTPLALIDAPSAGTGKSLLVDVFSTITMGRPGAMMPYPTDEAEMQKRILSSLIEGRPVICFDNLEGVLKSPALALALTAKEYQDRILGVSENIIVPNNAAWLVTGNNIRPSGDLPRRCYHIRLDAKSSQPFRGRTFKHANLLEWVTENRGRLLHALLMIARAWFAAGAPRKVQDPLGSFEVWHQTVGSILAYAGIDAFLGNEEEFLEEADDVAIEWENFLLVLADHYQHSVEFTIAELMQRLSMSEALKQALPASLAEVWDRKSGAFQKAIGYAFRKRKEQRFGDLQVYLKRGLETGHGKIAKWKVIVPTIDGYRDDVAKS